MNRKIFSAAVLILLVAFVFTGCGGNTEKEGSFNTIKIATVTPLSGPQAAIGEAIKNGAQMALEERQAEFKELGFDLVLAPQDDQADPKVGVSVAQKLIGEKDILAVCGHWNSGVAIPSSEVYAKENVVMVSPANTAVDVTERGLENVNRIVTRDDVQGPVGADFAVKDLGANKIFVVHDKTTYGQGVADEFKKQAEANGAEIVGYEGITAGDSDFNAVLNKLSITDADLVYFGGIYPEGSLFVKQMREKEIDAYFMGPDGMDSAEILKIAGEAAKGVFYTSPAANILENEKGRNWAQKYEERFKRPSENWSAYGYDAMNVIIDGIKAVVEENGGKMPNRDEVTAKVRNTKGFTGIAAKVTFDDIGDNIDAVVYVYKFEELEYPAAVAKEAKAGDYLK